MQWLDYDTAQCSIQRTLELVGEKWTFLVLREAFNGVRRFDQIRDHVGLSDSILSNRLGKLVEGGLLTAEPYREQGQRTRSEYRLTAKAAELYPVIIGLLQWGDRHVPAPSGPAVVVTHRDCGEPVEAVVWCAAGHRLEGPSAGHAEPGPGARRLDQAGSAF